MPSKYDTNPLDPDFPEKARAAAATQTLDSPDNETRYFGGSVTEEQTRRFASPDVSAYQQPFNGQYVPANYGPVAFAANDDTSKSRKVEKIGLAENIVTALPYIPWHFGLVAGALLLYLLPRSEAKSRFHAAQGLAAHLGILIVSTLLSVVSQVGGVSHAAGNIFQIVAGIVMIVFAVKAWRGKPIHIEAIDSLTNWLEEKIDSNVGSKKK